MTSVSLQAIMAGAMCQFFRESQPRALNIAVELSARKSRLQALCRRGGSKENFLLPGPVFLSLQGCRPCLLLQPLLPRLEDEIVSRRLGLIGVVGIAVSGILVGWAMALLRMNGFNWWSMVILAVAMPAFWFSASTMQHYRDRKTWHEFLHGKPGVRPKKKA
jgi:hypothetical protein